MRRFIGSHREEEARGTPSSKEHHEPTLNIGSYFARGTLPDVHSTIFEFIAGQVAK